MKQKTIQKVLATILCVCLCFSVVPMTAFASETNFVSETHDVFSRTSSTLAPGVTQDTVYAYAKDGKQMVYYVATADINRDDVEVHSSYIGAQIKEYGMDKLTNQMLAANEKYQKENEYFQAVVGVNGDFYNMATGQPSGAFYMDGEYLVNGCNNRPWFAIFEDGTALCGANNTDWNAAIAEHGAVQQAVGGSQMLVKNGNDVTATVSGTYNTTRASRTCVGVTADGKVVMMVLDGRQEPFSCGGTMHELAQIMLEANCVMAINLDGGGSSTFVTRPAGENDIRVINRPSDGSERSISSGLFVATTTPPSDVFDAAIVETDYDYYTPKSTIAPSANGVSPAGTPANIPSDAKWELSDDSFGTISNGVFVSNGKLGEVSLQLVYNNEVVGSKKVNIVNPDQVAFKNASTVAAYGSVVPMELVVTYENLEVGFTAEDFTWNATNASAGTFSGLNYIATTDSSITDVAITAVYKHCTMDAITYNISFGRGATTLFDFEDGTVGAFMGTDEMLQWNEENDFNDVAIRNGFTGNGMFNNEMNVFLSSEENGGQVKSGNYALGVNVEFTHAEFKKWNYDYFFYTDSELIVLRDTANGENATTVGMWVYVPEGVGSLDGFAAQLYLGTRNADGVYTPKSFWMKMLPSNAFWYENTEESYPESRWVYMYADISAYDYVYLDNKAAGNFSPAFFRVYCRPAEPISFNLYFDDITLNYGVAVDDSVAPIISNPTYSILDNATTFDVTCESNSVIFNANVADYDQNKVSGLNYSSAKIYVDGVELDNVTARENTIFSEEVTLTAGSHLVTFEIADNAGHVTKKTETLVISGTANITLGGHNESGMAPEAGSIYYVDINAADASVVDSITATVVLDTANTWEPEGVIVADGFEATVTHNPYANTVTVTVTRAGDIEVTGEQTIVSIPSRIWAWNDDEAESLDKNYMWTKSAVPTVKLDSKIVVGSVSYTADSDYSGYTGTFSGSISVATKVDDTKNPWHEHTAEAIADLKATCTEAGYTGRTYCEGCKSVVDWGTPISTTGHTYEVVDGVLKCSCGKLFNGEYDDGKTYVDGVVAAGWVENSYYVDGVALTGIQLVDDYYYNFGDDGVSQGRYIGFLEKEEGWYYIIMGTAAKGWQYIDGEYYYFDPITGLSYYGQEYYIYNQTYKFTEKGKLISGLWVESAQGTRYFYGPNYYYRTWAEIDGNTYYFDVDGYRKEGTCCFVAGINGDTCWYEFTDEGALVKAITDTGLFEYDGKLYYLENGVCKHGLYEVGGDYYYFNSSLTAVSGKYWVSNTNGIEGFVAGYYEFDETTHKMIREEVKNGLILESDGLHYYVDGVQQYAGLVQDDNGDYYYINSTLKAVSGRYWVEKDNGLLDKGFYEFDATTYKMIREEAKNGLILESDGLHYYVDGVQQYAGLVQDDNGDYYYINGSLKAVSGRYWVEKDNGLLDKGFYEFDATTYKMIREKAKTGLFIEDGNLYYYVDGVKQYGLCEVDGDYYYFNSSFAAVSGKYWVSNTNGIAGFASGFYEFDETTHKMIREEAKTGLFIEDGNLYYYVDGAKQYGLYEVDGDYYYFNSSFAAVSGKYWVSNTNGIAGFASGFYEFDETTHKMIRG